MTFYEETADLFLSDPFETLFCIFASEPFNLIFGDEFYACLLID